MAQLVERMAVNHKVRGSNPRGGGIRFGQNAAPVAKHQHSTSQVMTHSMYKRVTHISGLDKFYPKSAFVKNGPNNTKTSTIDEACSSEDSKPAPT
jgi:hypothetical protein